MEMALLDKHLWSIVDGTSVRPSIANGQTICDIRDQKAKASLITSLRNNQILLVTSAKTTKEVWDKLVTIFETKNITSNVFATTCFYSQNISEIESVKKHLSSFNVLKTQLEVVGTVVVDERAAIVLFGSLLESNDGFVMSLTKQNKLSIDEVIGLLFKEEMKKKKFMCLQE